MQREKILGEGAYGTVTSEGNLARKHFKTFDSMVREMIMLKYMKHSGKIVEVHGYNFANKSITMTRKDKSLMDLLQEGRLTETRKLSIFRDVLKGLVHIHKAGLIHTDVTVGNILFDESTEEACLCDLGLSSIKKYSSVHNTAPGFCPKKTKSCHGHDMYSLAVCMYVTFSYGKLKKYREASELRQLIRSSNIQPKVKEVMLKMVPDNVLEAITAEKALFELYRAKTNFELPDLTLYKVRLKDSLAEKIRSEMEALSNKYDINRGIRCYRCLVQFFSSPEGSKISIDYYDLYIVTAMYMYSCLYGSKNFAQEDILGVLDNRYSKEDFLNTLQVLISDSNFIAISLTSTHD